MPLKIVCVKEPSDCVKINDNIFHKSTNHLPFIRVALSLDTFTEKMRLLV